MDKYTKILIVLVVITGVMMVLGDIAYAKYRTSGHRLRSTLEAV